MYRYNIKKEHFMNTCDVWSYVVLLYQGYEVMLTITKGISTWIVKGLVWYKNKFASSTMHASQMKCELSVIIECNRLTK